MNSLGRNQFPEFDPDRQKFAIYTPSADLARWVAYQLGLTRREWFYVTDIYQLYGMRNIVLLFYGPYYQREDFPEIHMYWQDMMPPCCGYKVLNDTDLGEQNGLEQ